MMALCDCWKCWHCIQYYAVICTTTKCWFPDNVWTILFCRSWDNPFHRWRQDLWWVQRKYEVWRCRYSSFPLPSVESDWNTVIIECSSLASEWRQLSSLLGLALVEIESIKEDYHNDSSGCWSEAIAMWIRQNYLTDKFGLPSWRTLLRVVAKVDQDLFMELASNHQGSFNIPLCFKLCSVVNVT